MLCDDVVSVDPKSTGLVCPAYKRPVALIENRTPRTVMFWCHADTDGRLMNLAHRKTRTGEPTMAARTGRARSKAATKANRTRAKKTRARKSAKTRKRKAAARKARNTAKTP
jgi:hypothetical protein